jgi:hypothetical protein
MPISGMAAKVKHSDLTDFAMRADENTSACLAA